MAARLITFKPSGLRCIICESTDINITLNRAGTHIIVECQRCADKKIAPMVKK